MIKALFLLDCKSNHYVIAVSFIRLTAILLLFSFSHSPLFSSPGSVPLRLLPSGCGPEDIVEDSLHIPPRLLVSCASRRPEYPGYGEIEAIDPVNGNRLAMKRVGEPSGLLFRPHGISLVQTGEIQYLFVITHDDARGIHPIIQFLVDEDNLIFVKLLNSKLLVSPNALQAFPDGSLLVCNDAAERNSMKEKIFKLKKGNILFCDGLGNWRIVADQLGMPAGLTSLGNRIFVSSALENKVYSFNLINGELADKKQVCRVKGPDNIRINRNNLIITSHTKPIKFIQHVKDKSHKSPSLVLAVDAQSGKPTRLFSDDGKLISAASVALIFNNQLIIGQIFEPFIGVIDIER